MPAYNNSTGHSKELCSEMQAVKPVCWKTTIKKLLNYVYQITCVQFAAMLNNSDLIHQYLNSLVQSYCVVCTPADGSPTIILSAE